MNSSKPGLQWAKSLLQLVTKLQAKDILSFGNGNDSLLNSAGLVARRFDPYNDVRTDPAEVTVCVNFLEHVADERVHSVLDFLEQSIGKIGFLVLNTEPGLATARSMRWWIPQLRRRFTILHTQAFAQHRTVLLVGPHRLSQTERRRSPHGPRVFIGSEPRQWTAEAVLCHSIETTCPVEVDFELMDHSRGGVWGGWDRGRPVGHPATIYKNDDGYFVWQTEFTNYRWAIPELCGFKGRAIYLDSDIVVLSDIRELFNAPMDAPILALNDRETSVMLYDCEAMGHIRGWPKISEMKTDGWDIQQYLELLRSHNAFGLLDPRWNCLDGRGFVDGQTCLVHYTDMGTQPWRPYPDRIQYRAHPVPAMEQLWFQIAGMARNAGWFERPPEFRFAEREVKDRAA